MFRYLLLLVCLLFCFQACNNNSNGTAANAPMPEAEKQLRDQIAENPDSLILRENLVQYFRDNGNYDQAITETDIAIKKDTGNSRLWDIRATLCFEKGDTASAIHSFEKAIDIDPLPEYIMSLGSLYAQTRNPMALAMADGLLQAPKAHAELQAIFIKGLYYNYTGDKTAAIGYFDKCISMNYSFMEAYREKAIALYDLGKYDDAIQLLEKALGIHSTFDEGYYWLGRCYQKLNKNKDAEAAYRTALQIDPDYIEAKDALAKMGLSSN